jgi:predicted DNA-binding antitoxin AbrB/MazE fold protein
MTASVEAIYENGVFRPLNELGLREGARVKIAVLLTDSETSDPAYNLSELAEETGITDLATNIDHYLYGLPRQSDEQTLR